MPNVPGWFQAQDYFENKLKSMSYADAEDGAQQLVDAFNEGGFTIAGTTAEDIDGAADQLFRHFYEYGNAENISPNNYFNVDFYKAAKVAALNEAGTQTPPDGAEEWTTTNLDAFMASLGLSYWDHYTQYGTMEGINPSPEFNTNEYLDLKLKQLNDEANPQPLPDGSEGPWTREDLCEALRDADLNAVEHYELYNTIDGVGYVPGSEPSAEDRPLTVGQETVSDEGMATNFIGVVNSDGTSTLDRTDVITGTNDGSQLSVTLNTLWQGFQGQGRMEGIKTVNVHEGSAQYDFSGTGSKGVETYNVFGNADLVHLQEGVKNVTLHNVDARSAEISFDASVVKGASDSLNLSLYNVATTNTNPATGEVTAANVQLLVNGIENLTVNSQNAPNPDNPTEFIETTNRIDARDTSLAALNITGDADLNMVTGSTKLNTVDASQATGDITLTADHANKLANVTLGSGDDTIMAGLITKTAQVNGGEGNDEIVLNGSSSGTYKLTTDSVETIGLNSTGAVTIDGSNMKGFETVAMTNQSSAVTVANVGTQVNFSATGTNTAKITGAEVTDLFMTVGDGVESVGLNNDSYNGVINTKNLTNLTVDVVESDATFDLAKGSNLNYAQALTFTGEGSADISAVTNIGSKGEALNVQAAGLETNFNASFTGSTKGNQSIFISGAAKNNNIDVNGKYQLMEITSDSANDFIDATGIGAYDANKMYVDLGSGNDAVLVNSADKASWESHFANTDVAVVTSYDDARLIPVISNGMKIDMSAATSALTSNIDLSGLENTDFSGVTWKNGQVVQYTGLQDDQTLVIGATNGATGTASGGTFAPNTQVIAPAGSSDINIEAAIGGAQIGIDLQNLATNDLTVNLDNTSGGTVQFAPVPPAGSASTDNVNWFHLQTLNLDTGYAGSSLEVVGYNKTSPTAFDDFNYVRMTNVETVEISGAGNVVLNATLGKTGVATTAPTNTITVDASGNAGDVQINSINAQTIDYTGAAGNDVIGVMATGFGQANASTIELGAGADTVLVEVGDVDGVTSANYRVINIDLGDDNAKDTVGLTGALGTNKGGALVSISNFELGEDQIIWSGIDTNSAFSDLPQSAVTSSLRAATVGNLSSSAVIALLENFGVIQSGTGDQDDVKFIVPCSGGNAAFTYDGSTYFAVIDNSATGNVVDGMVLVELQGVTPALTEAMLQTNGAITA